MDELILKISNSGITIPTLTSSPPFPRFLGWKWKQRRANLGIFRIQPRNQPPGGGFSNFFSLWRINNPLAPQAAHNDAPYTNRWQLPLTAILLLFFFRTCPWHYQKNEQQKNFQLEQNVDKVWYYTMDSQQFQNKDHSGTVPKKCMIGFYVLFRTIKKGALGTVQ